MNEWVVVLRNSPSFTFQVLDESPQKRPRWLRLLSKYLFKKIAWTILEIR